MSKPNLSPSADRVKPAEAVALIAVAVFFLLGFAELCRQILEFFETGALT